MERKRVRLTGLDIAIVQMKDRDEGEGGRATFYRFTGEDGGTITSFHLSTGFSS